MSRRILCQSCGDKWKPHPEDTRQGWRIRVVHVSLKKPEDHSVTVVTGMTSDELISLMAKGVPKGRGKTTQLPEIYCDKCGEVVPEGTVALAVTMWRDEQGEIGNWEQEYGTVLPEQAAKMERVLSKQPPNP